MSISVDYDVAVYVGGEQLLASSLVLMEASPFLGRLLTSVNHCDGCSTIKTIVLAEENLDNVNILLSALNAKFLQVPPSRFKETSGMEDLCRGLEIKDVLWPSFPSVPEPSMTLPEETDLLTIVEVCTASEGDEMQPQETSSKKSSPHSNSDEGYSDHGEEKEEEGNNMSDEKSSPNSECALETIPAQSMVSVEPSPTFTHRRPIRQRYLVRPSPFEKNRRQSFEQEESSGKSTKALRQKHFCGNCLGCAREEDCGECHFCLDKPKFGGPGIKKQKCELRWCEQHPRINRGPGSLRREALKCIDCSEEYYSYQVLDSHMKIAHDKYEANDEYYKIKDPSLTFKRVDKDQQFAQLFPDSSIEYEEVKENTDSADEPNRVSGDVSKQMPVREENNSAGHEGNSNTSRNIGKSDCLSPEEKLEEIRMMKCQLKRALEDQQNNSESSPRKKPRILLTLKVGVPCPEINDMEPEKRTKEKKKKGKTPRDYKSVEGSNQVNQGATKTNALDQDKRPKEDSEGAACGERSRRYETKSTSQISLPIERSKVQRFKCSLCDQTEVKRSDLYAHYASSHFRNQLVQRLGAEKRECTKHKLTFQSQINMVVHFGRVHSMVEDFLPPEHRLPVTSQGTISTGASKKKRSKVRKRKRTKEHNIKESDSAKFKSPQNAQMYIKNRENAMSNSQSARKCQSDCDEAKGLEVKEVGRPAKPSHIEVGPKKKERVFFLEDIVSHEEALLRLRGKMIGTKSPGDTQESKDRAAKHDLSQRAEEERLEERNGEHLAETDDVDSDEDDFYVQLDESDAENEDLVDKVKHGEEVVVGARSKGVEEDNKHQTISARPFTSTIAHIVPQPLEIDSGTSMAAHHIVQLPSQCSKCGEQFSSVRRAIIHEVEICQSVERRSHPSFKMKIFKCGPCEKNFVLRRKFELHMERHKGEGEILIVNHTTLRPEAMGAIIEDGEACKTELTSSSDSEGETTFEEAKQLYQSKMNHLTTTSPDFEEPDKHGQLKKGDEECGVVEEFEQGEENEQGKENGPGGENGQGEEYEQGKENGQGERNFKVENEEELYRPCDEDLIDIKDDIKDIRAIFSSDEEED